mmetsp:Transcript_12743/g.27948  ORF Transcript_12743/g.27948 Transcript_12743/m.27948 type:complete len:259 (+) Transcript_12743:638-1414(+)
MEGRGRGSRRRNEKAEKEALPAKASRNDFLKSKKTQEFQIQEEGRSDISGRQPDAIEAVTENSQEREEEKASERRRYCTDSHRKQQGDGRASSILQGKREGFAKTRRATRQSGQDGKGVRASCSDFIESQAKALEANRNSTKRAAARRTAASRRTSRATNSRQDCREAAERKSAQTARRDCCCSGLPEEAQEGSSRAQNTGRSRGSNKSRSRSRNRSTVAAQEGTHCQQSEQARQASAAASARKTRAAKPTSPDRNPD